jgi:protein-S-isoprenylcysteine O-methyltransferase Ste14
MKGTVREDWRTKMVRPERSILNRSKLRDIILLCCFASTLIYSVNNTGIIIGFVMLVLGCFLHIVAKGILVRNIVFTNRGLYRIVRHPYYFANYLIDSGFCVLSGNPYLLLVYPFLFFWAYGPTLRNEEKLLNEKHGATFLNDSFIIPQVFPDSSSLRGLKRLFESFSLKRITTKECSRVARFSSLGFAIILIHELKPEGLGGLTHLLIPTKYDFDEFVFMLVATMLFIFSLVFEKAANSDHGGTDRRLERSLKKDRASNYESGR